MKSHFFLQKVILQIAETHRVGVWVKLMLYCGLRPGETAGLLWKHVDLKNKKINIVQALKEDGSCEPCGKVLNVK